ncbi:FkbM family methyltransferase [Thalassovita mediterranea]|nr:FkbM family methyltransferase [Thalassovita mediterranea]
MVIDAVVRRAVTLVPHSMRGFIRNLPLIGPAQRKLVDSQLAGKTFLHKVDAGPSRGIVYELTMPEDKGIWTGNYEPEFASRLAAEMRPGMVGYDIGAWHGYFTGIMLANGASKVVMFEPLPENRVRLVRMMDSNPGFEMIIREEALGDRQGKATLAQLEDTSMAKLSDSPFEPEHNTGKKITVTLNTIDAMVAERTLPPPDIIKIDVEGAEGMVLRGAEETIASARPVILAEIHSGSLLQEVTSLLEQHNYCIESLDASKLHRAADAGHICAYPKS